MIALRWPPQWATKVMNRATADNQSAQAEEEGLEPTKEWVKDLIDEIISEEFASPDLELAWLDEDEADPKGLEAVLEGRVKLGAVTLNEMRDALGLDPYANPAADRPMVLTATGYVPIEAGAEGKANPSGTGTGPDTAAARMSDLSAEASNGAKAEAKSRDLWGTRRVLSKDYNPDQPRVPAGSADGGQWTSAVDAGIAANVDDPLDYGGHTGRDVSADAADPARTPVIQIAASGTLPCDGFSGGCQSGGTYGTNAMYHMSGLNLCRECAAKFAGVENELSREQTKTLSPFQIQGR